MTVKGLAALVVVIDVPKLDRQIGRGRGEVLALVIVVHAVYWI